MEEFDEKLNSLLSNPDAMAQIMQLAQSLGGGNQDVSDPKPRQSERRRTESSVPIGCGPESGDPLTSLLGNPSLLLKLMPLMQELGGQGDSNARALLYALRPYLKAERQNKIERALQLARLFRIGKRFLAEWEGS